MTISNISHQYASNSMNFATFATMNIQELQPFDVGDMRRVGDMNDGGYVLPRSLPTIEFLVSFGLGDNWSFEKGAVAAGIVDNFCVYDHTVSGATLFSRFVRRVIHTPTKFKAIRYRFFILLKYLVDFKVRRLMHLKKQITASSLDSKKTNLIEIAKAIESPRFGLKIDIEGDEYLVIDQIVFLSSRIPLLIVEFHATDSRRVEFSESLRKLREEYRIVHTHCNNFTGVARDGIPITLELTFLHKDFVDSKEKVKRIPRSGIDSPSSPARPDITLRFTS